MEIPSFNVTKRSDIINYRLVNGWRSLESQGTRGSTGHIGNGHGPQDPHKWFKDSKIVNSELNHTRGPNTYIGKKKKKQKTKHLHSTDHFTAIHNLQLVSLGVKAPDMLGWYRIRTTLSRIRFLDGSVMLSKPGMSNRFRQRATIVNVGCSRAACMKSRQVVQTPESPKLLRNFIIYKCDRRCQKPWRVGYPFSKEPTTEFFQILPRLQFRTSYKMCGRNNTARI
jgi:hypothetical protein